MSYRQDSSNAGRDAKVAIERSRFSAAPLPDRALRLVREWATLHRGELEADWQRARDGQPFERIPRRCSETKRADRRPVMVCAMSVMGGTFQCANHPAFDAPPLAGR